jgi:hypothetical protein
MKKLKSVLLLTALASLIYVVNPSDALAQMGSSPPCCYKLPSNYASFANDGTQSMIVPTQGTSHATSIHLSYLGGQLASLQTNRIELQESMQFGIEPPKISFTEIGITNRFLVRDRERYYGEQT